MRRSVEVEVPGSPELPARPLPPRAAGELVGAWLRWFGVGRVMLSALSMVVVLAGAAWLLRAPAPATEARLPMASVASAPAPTGPTPASSTPTATSIVVHVAGAVASPGVVTLLPGAHVGDAVAAAGGAAAEGNLDAVNLAAALVDGQRVYVPRSGEVDPATLPSAGGSDGVASAGDPAPHRTLDLNQATAAELEMLPGIGPATAEAIVDDRTRNGPFATVDDLDRVSGIGAAKIDRLRSQVTV